MNITRSNPFVSDYKAVCADLTDPCVRRLRGNPKSRILLIAPPPTAQDIERGMPLSNDDEAQKFHQKLQSETGYSTEADMLVMCGSPYPRKATKKHTEPFRELVLRHADKFSLVVVIGGDHFKFMFGNGKKSSMNTLCAGTLIYLPKLLKHTPVFIFPEIAALGPKWTNDRDKDWKIQLDLEKCEKWLDMLFPKFVNATTELEL